MAPRRTARNSPLAQVIPSASDTHSRARPQTNVDKEESFDLDGVSGGDDSDSNNSGMEERNLRHPGDTQGRTTGTNLETIINDINPAQIVSKRSAVDVNHFLR
ncbi:hypothetical protein EDB84DRAFT_1444342 [Lactarius hengduanensis]|nr:hypothetical protein EDB84DRAFT_1444342 [Lactarius hengduanensis]